MATIQGDSAVYKLDWEQAASLQSEISLPISNFLDTHLAFMGCYSYVFQEYALKSKVKTDLSFEAPTLIGDLYGGV